MSARRKRSSKQQQNKTTEETSNKFLEANSFFPTQSMLEFIQTSILFPTLAFVPWQLQNLVTTPSSLSQRQDKEELHKTYSKLYSFKKKPFKLVRRKEKA
jgi:hypothetical protein